MIKQYLSGLTKKGFIHTERFSIRTKLTVPYIALAMLIALAGGLIVSQVLIDSVEERFTNQLIETRKLASELLVRVEKRMLETLRLVTHTEGMAEITRQGDKDKIMELIYPVIFNSGEEAVLVLNSNGEIIASIIKSVEENKYTFPDIRADLTNFPFVQKVVNQEIDEKGDKYSGFTSDDWGSYFFVSGPLNDQDGNLQGIILVGKTLTSIVAQIRQETLSQATIYDANLNPTLSTLPNLPPRVDYNPSLITSTKDNQSLMREVENNSIRYIELLGSWTVRDSEDIGFIGTAIPKTFLVRTSNLTRMNVAVVFITAIIMAMLLGIFLSNLITRPILILKKAATEVANGNLEIHVDARGGDEVAVLATSFNEMVFHLKKSEKELMTAYDKTVEGWGKALELRDQETQGHAVRVTELTLDIARMMDIDEKDIPNIRRGALLHDIGKIGIPDAILLKPGSLNNEEWEIMKKHTIFARDMLKVIEFLQPSMDIPTFHHEKWDGSGYPFGLVGKEIPLAARIFAIVDVWDALTSDRPYRKAMLIKEAREIIQKGLGTHFDPEVVKTFNLLIDKQYVKQVKKPFRAKVYREPVI